MKSLFGTSSSSRRTLLLAALLLTPSLALAHTGVGAAHGFNNGLAHPLTGWDHLLAMVAVGLWASQRGGRFLWAVPLAFVSVMTLGAALGMAAISIPFVETGIVASVLILGVLIAASVRLPLAASAILAGVFALFHGHAHGAEMSGTFSSWFYGAGFVLTTAGLHLCGMGIGLLARRFNSATLIRYAGGAIAACGVYLFFVG